MECEFFIGCEVGKRYGYGIIQGVIVDIERGEAFVEWDDGYDEWECLDCIFSMEE